MIESPEKPTAHPFRREAARAAARLRVRGHRRACENCLRGRWDRKVSVRSQMVGSGLTGQRLCSMEPFPRSLEEHGFPCPSSVAVRALEAGLPPKAGLKNPSASRRQIDPSCRSGFSRSRRAGIRAENSRGAAGAPSEVSSPAHRVAPGLRHRSSSGPREHRAATCFCGEHALDAIERLLALPRRVDSVPIEDLRPERPAPKKR